MIFGYARVSTYSQDLRSQTLQLEAAGCEKIFADIASGGKTRPQLQLLLQIVRAGDELIVCKIDRLSRDLKDLLLKISTLGDQEVAFRALDLQIDTKTPHGRLLLGLIGSLAEWERDMIRVRTREGLEAARQAGVRIGRPPRLSPLQKEEVLRRGRSEMVTSAKMFGVSRRTVYRVFKQQEKEQQEAHDVPTHP